MFQRFIYQIQRFMYGRYGGDSLNIFLLILGLIISFAAQISGVFWIGLFAYIPEIYFIFRVLSRNIPARQRELRVFQKVWFPVKHFFTRTCGSWFKYQAEKFRYRSVYKYFSCPKCGQHLRAPRGRGKILVTCQRCHTEFKKKV